MLAGSQVSLEYDIDLSLTQIPENLIFYSDAEMTKALYKDNGVIHLDGYFGASDSNKTATKNLYWRWKLETGSSQAEIDSNDLLDSEWIGDRIVLGVEAKGRQVMDSPITQYEVTFDLNGGTLASHGDSTQITKQVTYGEIYGDLPTPKRDGYFFKGWNGKNLFELKNTPDFVNANTGYSVNTGEKSVTIGRDGSWELIEYYLPELKANTTYAISGCVDLVNSNRTYIRISKDRAMINNNHFILNMTVQNGEFKGTFTTENDIESNLALLLFGNWDGGTVNARVKISNIMIEEGSTATAYEPYYITSSTEVVQNQNHTLTAIWEPKSN